MLMQTSYPLTPEQKEDWTKHALSCFPEEACAYIVDDKIFPVKNIHSNPTEQGAISAIDRLEAQKGKISGFLHTHADTPLQAGQKKFPAIWPTTQDMRSFYADDTRWGISTCDGETVSDPVWLDEDYIAPLIGRQFIHGIWDCYSVIRDWYRLEKGIELMRMPRGMEWWNKGENLYEENFRKAGFVEIEASEVLPGDIILMYMPPTETISHAAVVVDANTLLHHTFSRNGHALSCYIPISGRWSNHFAKYIRYSPNNK